MLDFNLAGRHTILEAGSTVPPGARLLTLDVSRDGAGDDIATLAVDGEDRASAPLPRSIPGGIGTLSLQCGHNDPSPVSERYAAPFAFTGTLHHVDIVLGERWPDSLWHETRAELSAQ